MGKRGGAIRLKPTPEFLRVIGRVAIAIGAGDNQQRTFFLPINGCVLRSIYDASIEAARGCFFGDSSCEALGSAGLAAKENEKRNGWLRMLNLRRIRDSSAGEVTGQKAI